MKRSHFHSLCIQSSFVSLPRRGPDEKPTKQFMYLFLHGRSLFNVSIHLLPTATNHIFSFALASFLSHAHTLLFTCNIARCLSVRPCYVHRHRQKRINVFSFAGIDFHKLSAAHTRSQFIEVDELDIRIYFTVLIKWGAKFIYTQRTTHNDSVADADIFTNIYLKSILCGGCCCRCCCWYTSVHNTRTYSLSLLGFYSIVLEGFTYTLFYAHIKFVFGVFFNSV